MRDRAWRADWAPTGFVWGAWLLATFYLVRFVETFGTNVPHYDEWENVPALAGAQAINLRWLWSQHNEHRIFLPRLAYLTVTWLSGDFRAGVFLNAALLSLAAGVLIAVARRVRGHTEYSDAFFPLLVQTWGQSENLINSFQIQFVSSGVLAIVFLVCSVRSLPATARALGLGVCGLMLPLVGGNGLGIAPAVSVATFYAGWLEWKRTPGPNARSLCVWALGLFAAALTAYYFVDYRRPSGLPPSRTWSGTFVGALQFLSMGFGQAAHRYWPITKPWLVFALAATLATLGYVALFRERERETAIRVGFVIGGMLSLALGLGWARSALSDDAMFAPRYATLAAPMWCAVYLAWETLGQSQLRKLAQACLFGCSLALLVENHDQGQQYSQPIRSHRLQIIDDIERGVPVDEIVERHHSFTYYGGRRELRRRMLMLHAQKIGVFGKLKK